AETQYVHSARSEVFDGHIRAFDKLLEQLLAHWHTEGECESALAPRVLGAEGTDPFRIARLERGTEVPSVIGVGGTLDLDDRCTKVSQNHRTERSCHHACDVENHHPGQWSPLRRRTDGNVCRGHRFSPSSVPDATRMRVSSNVPQAGLTS